MVSVGVAVMATTNHVDEFKSQKKAFLMVCRAHHPKIIHVFSGVKKTYFLKEYPKQDFTFR